ncbi:MAG: aminotransferase class I/II-fold pyridoxal phosphate-dependent enzyme [Flavobacteriia bacterium]|nr:aminotransferase class I/II-fold pyridoxal phosphate-dependent enzyme [Flavobacteriia bacterium]
MIDFRSDTVTKPSKEMLEFMFSAEVGDDVFNEDPTVNFLQQKIATLFGKEDALFCSSGTQTNQIAINVHTQPGGEVICHYDSHVYKYEGGGIAKNSGVSCRLLQGDRGRLTVDEIKNWLNPDDVHYPITQLVCVEDTANRGGGAVYDFNELKKIKSFCKENDLKLHLDGARIFNALIVNKIDYVEYASLFDSVSICLSKGLGAPVGSLLLGNKEFIKKARRVRKVLGGGMRQAGYLATAGIYALDNNVNRLKKDHFHAKELEKTFLELDWVKELTPVETNIVVVHLKFPEKRDLYIQKLKEKEILCMAFGPGMLRFVTHLNISSEDIQQTIKILHQIVT